MEKKTKITGGLVFLLLIAGSVVAQQLYVGPTSDSEIRWAKKSDFDGSIIFCRGQYASTRYEENGSGFWTDYPGADHNFLVRLSELTEVRVRFSPGRIPFYVVMGLADPLLMKCPILFMEDVGTIGFDEHQIKNLRHYFDQGGFLWVDDFWGELAWRQWEYEIRRVLPSAEFKMIDIKADHPIFHQLYDVDGIWQMPTISLWRADEEYPTSERGFETAQPEMKGIVDDEGRVIVVMTFNTDIADGWEEEKPENMAFIQEFSARSYALGVNILLYALTH